MDDDSRRDLDQLNWDEMDARQVKRAGLVAAWLVPRRRVVDVGSGPGFVRPRAARRAGPAGLVCAIDRLAEAPAYLGHLQHEQGSGQVRRVVVDADMPGAETIRADAALVTMLLHHIADPRGVLRAIARTRAARGDARVAAAVCRRCRRLPSGRTAGESD